MTRVLSSVGPAPASRPEWRACRAPFPGAYAARLLRLLQRRAVQTVVQGAYDRALATPPGAGTTATVAPVLSRPDDALTAWLATAVIEVKGAYAGNLALCRACGGEGYDDDGRLCHRCHGSGDATPALPPRSDP